MIIYKNKMIFIVLLYALQIMFSFNFMINLSMINKLFLIQILYKIIIVLNKINFILNFRIKIYNLMNKIFIINNKILLMNKMYFKNYLTKMRKLNWMNKISLTILILKMNNKFLNYR